MTGGQLGQTGFGHLPAPVAEAAGEGRLADHVAGDAHRGGVETFRQGDAATFVFSAQGLDAEVLAQHLAATFVDHTGGGADVGIRIRLHIFLDELDEAGVALQQAEQLQRGFVGRFAKLGRRDRRFGRHDRLDAVVQRFDTGGEAGLGQDGEKASAGEREAAHEGGIGSGHGKVLVSSRALALKPRQS